VTILSDLKYRLRAILRRRAVEDDLDAELRFHLEQQTCKHVENGVGANEAGRAARLEFGPVERVKEECRDARGLAAVEAIWQDLRYAFRGLRRAWMFTATVVLTIGLGIGVNTAAFTVYNAYLLRPLPVDQPYSLFEFTWTNRTGRGHWFTWEEYESLGRETAVFSAAFAERSIVTRINGKLAFGAMVTRNYFQVLGVGASRGRVLTKSDGAAEASAPPVVVLSHTGWTALFGGDPAIVGRQVRIGGVPLEVIGITPAGFTGLGERPCDFWAPLSVDAALTEGPDPFDPVQPGRLSITGRLRQGVTERTGRSALALWAAATTRERPEGEQATGTILMSQATRIPLPIQMLPAVLLIAAAFGLVLLIACANVTNMMLTRAMSRHREIGVRMSLGASRARLVQQLMIESLLLALPAGGIGFGVAYVTTHLGVMLVFATMPAGLAEAARHLASLEPDVRVFGFSVAAGLMSACLFGLAPAVQATRISVARAFAGELMLHLRPARLRSALVVAQVAGSVMLLIWGTLLLRSAVSLADMDIGMNALGVIDLEIRDKSRAQILEALASSPVVQQVAATSPPVPFDGALPRVSVTTPGNPETLQASFRFVSPDYFGLFDMPIRNGRTFSTAEAAARGPVAIVSETAARRLWPNRGAIGQLLRVHPSEERPQHSRPIGGVVEIVGTVRDVATMYSNDEASRTTIYLPTDVIQPGNPLLVRVAGNVDAAARSLDAALTAIDARAVRRIDKIDDFVLFRTYPFRVAHWISSAIGILALLLTLSGVYGVLSYLVSMRSKEIGIRMALGGTARGAATGVLSQSMRLSAIGVAVGAMVSLGGSAALSSRLVAMNAYDPVAYGVVILVVVTTCACASFIPALRAARIDPLVMLRHD
jgi:putative ABC transport system permease protein